MCLPELGYRPKYYVTRTSCEVIESSLQRNLAVVISMQCKDGIEFSFSLGHPLWQLNSFTTGYLLKISCKNIVAQEIQINPPPQIQKNKAGQNKTFRNGNTFKIISLSCRCQFHSQGISLKMDENSVQTLQLIAAAEMLTILSQPYKRNPKFTSNFPLLHRDPFLSNQK